jgi:hypothetical protein
MPTIFDLILSDCVCLASRRRVSGHSYGCQLVLDKRHSHALDQWHAANSENSQGREFFCWRVREAVIRQRW